MPDTTTYQGHRKRLRDRLMQNPTALADYEILELLLAQVLLRKDTKALAKQLLNRFESLRGVLDARASELAAVAGFGPALTSFWVLLRESMARYAEGPLRKHEVLASPEAVANMARQRLSGKAHEEVWTAFVDSQNRLLSWELACSGSLDSSSIYPRDILERALLLKASGFIVVHNHPGGNTSASPADLAATLKLGESANACDIRFIDHIIVSDQGWYSVCRDTASTLLTKSSPAIS
jgi:DNA repair protein RadC